MKKDPFVFLKHIRDAIDLVDSFTKNYTKTKFLNDKLVQSAVIRQIEIIGEATKNVPLNFRKKYQKIPWSNIAGMRDKLIRLYFGVNLERVWEVVKEDIPKLKQEINTIIEKEKTSL
ncbi:MAG: DUF86 domain-containing protein [Nanoarchaeota archaeon]|nr:DUF86 domain-containing protein [Nanoarchaeota archaeon]MBU1644678.1 DUF86 domain-containing protein [Nanoarchaeota archaeon]MBU1976573.1 DUF86 domain-containing protein [Nanoarchaeota archaeon]